jgi:hypothetical protein
MTTQPSLYRRHRFPAEIISNVVWLYHFFSLSLRDIALILAECGVVVTHESIRHWCRTSSVLSSPDQQRGDFFGTQHRRQRAGIAQADELAGQIRCSVPGFDGVDRE